MKVLVTGGTGYIASHTVVQLLEAGHTPILLDNYSNSSPAVLKRIENITSTSVECHKVDLEDSKALDGVLTRHLNLKTGKCEIEAVIHFAGRKCVPESLLVPLEYYRTNITSTLNVLQAMHDFGIPNLIFSSSAAVYGSSGHGRYDEEAPVQPTNPYATSKATCERIIEDCARAMNLNVISLRYFNPVGAHPSGLLGEDPRALNNLFPILARCAHRSEPLLIHGFDYETVDGTAVRDYLHVMDVAQGHLQALKYIITEKSSVREVINLGSGQGTSVLEAVRLFTRTTGANVPFRLGPRRPGDAAVLVAQVSKAESLLNWRPQYTLEAACKDLWKWTQLNSH